MTSIPDSEPVTMKRVAPAKHAPPAVDPSAPVVLNNVSRWYGEVIGVNDIDVSIPAGVTGLLGPNGAGKTTLIRLITGQIRPSKGEVRVLGESVWNNAGIYRRIGLCPDLDSFWETMTGFEFVRYMARLAGYSTGDASARALAQLERVSLTYAKDRKVGGYSKGMRQRVKLAQAMVHDPELVVLDEPLTGLDPVGRREVIELVRELGEQGRHVVVSSHILHEVEAMTPRILLIHRGRIVAAGEVHDIRSMIDEHPHRIEIECDDVRALARKLLDYDDVIRVAIEDDANRLRVETIRPDDFYSRVPELAIETGIGIERMTSSDDNLEAVFHYLVK